MKLIYRRIIYRPVSLLRFHEHGTARRKNRRAHAKQKHETVEQSSCRTLSQPEYGKAVGAFYYVEL
jgi:hypothetical protein